MPEKKRVYEAAGSPLQAIRYQAVGDKELEQIVHGSREYGTESSAFGRDGRLLTREVVQRLIKLLKEL